MMPPNEGNRHPPLASAERLGCLFIGLACPAQRRVPVAEPVSLEQSDESHVSSSHSF